MFNRNQTLFTRSISNETKAGSVSSGSLPIGVDPMFGRAGLADFELPPLASYDPYLNSATLMSDNAEKGVKWLNRLLRGEISAIETYEIVVKDDSLHNQEVRTLLEHNLREHREARSFLERIVMKWRGEPDTGSGVWGVFTEALTAGARTLSHVLEIDTLARGEEHGRSEYASMRDEMNPQSEIATLARDMLRAQERHTRRLDSAKRSLELAKGRHGSVDSGTH